MSGEASCARARLSLMRKSPGRHCNHAMQGGELRRCGGVHVMLGEQVGSEARRSPRAMRCRHATEGSNACLVAVDQAGRGTGEHSVNLLQQGLRLCGRSEWTQAAEQAWQRRFRDNDRQQPALHGPGCLLGAAQPAPAGEVTRCSSVPWSHTNAAVMPGRAGQGAAGEAFDGVRSQIATSHRQQQATHPPRCRHIVSSPVRGCW